MASCSEEAAADYGRTNTPVSHAARETSRSQGPRGRINSADVTHCGGYFVESGHDEDTSEYPAQLEISEEEDRDRQPQNRYQRSSQHRSMSRGGNPSLASHGSSTANMQTPILTRAHLQPYLQPGDLESLGLCNADGRSCEWQTRDSVQRSPTSSAASAVAYAPSVSPTTTLSTTHNQTDHNNNHSSRYRPYFSPSHTPSHHSMATEEDEGEEVRGPTSPLPYSTYHTYNAHYARGIMDDFEYRINGQ